jgi:catechol 2,3-dioxygenase-like lactoylglutathione lyase family enzyme
MEPTHVFAGLRVTDYETARAWYERVLGRPPDMLPNADEAVWHLAGAASIYVVAGHEHAGGGLLTVAVDSMEGLLAELAACGVPARTERPVAGMARVSVSDPDGNAITFFEPPTPEARRGEPFEQSP